MLFSAEKILILHPGKCGGTTIENLFLRSLRNTTLQQVHRNPYFSNVNSNNLTTEHVRHRVESMMGSTTSQLDRSVWVSRQAEALRERSVLRSRRAAGLVDELRAAAIRLDRLADQLIDATPSDAPPSDATP